MSELKPCPFCSGKPKLHIDCFHTWSAFCTNIKFCNARTSTFKHKISAINAWNKRPTEEALTEINRLQSEENNQLAEDKAELLDAVSSIASIADATDTSSTADDMDEALQNIYNVAKGLMEKCQ